MSDLETQMQTPIGRNRCIRSWIIVRRKRKINKVSTVTNNSPFVLSVDGMFENETLAVLKNLSQPMATKLNKTLSHIHGWINGRIAIKIVKLYSRMSYRSRLPITLRDW